METNSSCVCASGYRNSFLPQLSTSNSSAAFSVGSSLLAKEPVAGCDPIPVDIYSGLGKALFFAVVAGAPAVLVTALAVGCLTRLALREADRMRLIRRGIVKYCDECDARAGDVADVADGTSELKLTDISTPLHAIRADAVEVNASLCVLLPPPAPSESQAALVATGELKATELHTNIVETLPIQPPQPPPVARLTSDGGPAGDPGGRARARWGGASVGPPEAPMLAVARAAAASARADPPPVGLGEVLSSPAVPLPRLDGTAASGVLVSRFEWAGLGPGMTRETVGRRQTVRLLVPFIPPADSNTHFLFGKPNFVE